LVVQTLTVGSNSLVTTNRPFRSAVRMGDASAARARPVADAQCLDGCRNTPICYARFGMGSSWLEGLTFGRTLVAVPHLSSAWAPAKAERPSSPASLAGRPRPPFIRQ